jgi:signal transduction histidine kinase
VLSVEDDGIGFEPAPPNESPEGKSSMGLLIMSERIVQVRGELSIESRPGAGTLILAEIPLQDA